MRVIFMGTPDFAVPTLESIIDSGHTVELVVTQMDKKKGRGKKITHTPVKESAIKNGIEVFQPENINAEDSIEKLKAISPDIIVVVAYGQILSEDILNLPKHGCLNVHASILPKYRGPAPINWAIINGEEESGVTIMQMESGLDTGDIINIEKIDIDESMTAGDLHDELMDIGAKALVETISQIEGGNVDKTPQNHENATYAPKMNKKLGEIDWNKSSESIRDLIRGTQPWPGAYFYYKGSMIKVRQADLVEKSDKYNTGKILKADQSGIYISSEDGVLRFTEIQAPGKRWMSVEDYLRGNDIDTDISLL